MNRKLNKALSKHYKSQSQQVRIITENWVEKEITGSPTTSKNIQICYYLKHLNLYNLQKPRDILSYFFFQIQF